MSLEYALEEERLEILKLLERPAGPASTKYVLQTSNIRSPPPFPRTTSPARGRPHPGTPMGGISSMILAAERTSHSSSPPPFSSRSIASRDTSPHTSIPSSYNRRSSAGQTSRPLSSQSFASSTSPQRSGSPTIQQARSSSPTAGNLPLSPFASPPLNMGLSSQVSRKMLSQNDTLIDLDYAYRRLNDDALRKSGGSLAALPDRGGVAGHVRPISGESIKADGGVRLERDSSYGDGEEEVDSSEDSDISSDVDEVRGRSQTSSLDGPSPKERRRNSKSRKSSIGSLSSSALSSTLNDGGQTTSSASQTTMSLLAAAEEERKTVSSRYSVSSLLPDVAVPSQNTTQTNTNKNYIHPNTNYDVHYHVSTPFSSDTEENAKDLKRAARMTLNVSPILSTPESSRLVRTITRGDFASLQEDVENGRRKQRSYLVATDLSAEAAHALEWTIGTVLRDGDTLLAIYAIDEEAGGDAALVAVVQELKNGNTPSRVESSIAGLRLASAHPNSSPFAGQYSNGVSEDFKGNSNPERERWVAAEGITAIVNKLLKKTRLQVNVVVEVIHCKSPKHLLTEMIDIIEPTMVVLGSRGRSALKGVLLGSFSNYLVTKSSVPVMVARRKLKKTKYMGTNVRLSNNLAGAEPGTIRGLALAKVD